LVRRLAPEIPQSNVDGGGSAIFRAGARLRHRQVDEFLVQRLDAQRIATEKARRQRVVNMGGDGARPIERLAETDDTGVGVKTHP
jgi:hypothetical protein